MGYFLKNRQLQSGSTGVVIPTGSSATRPDAPVFGLIRYNTDTGYIEYFNGSVFQSLTVTGGINYTVDNFTGDGSDTVFTMSIAESNADEIIVFVGSLYQIPTTNYTVDGGFDITFTSAPPLGIPINVIHSSS
jgi:stress response protein SCP2